MIETLLRLACLTVLGSGYNQNKTMNKAFDNYENLKKDYFRSA
jgi:hypothetical protein